MLTVRYERLGLQPGDRLLDLGCGFGRHAFEAARRGARVVAVDYADTELKEVRNTFGAMADAGEVDPASCLGAVQGDATRLPFADETFDRIIASEVLEHIPADEAAIGELARVLRPGGTIAVTVPAYLPERICWSLSDEYHAPFVTGGHVRIYREWALRAKLRAAALAPGFAHHAHALHSPYWWLKCATGVHRLEPSWPVRRYHDQLVRQIEGRAPGLTALERAMNPVLGKSLVVYAQRCVP